MFRGKESSNRIELSQLVQDLLNFGVLGSLWLWGWGVSLWAVGGGRCPHTCTHAHTHVQKLQMAADMEASMFIMFSMFMHVCACMWMCVCMGHTDTHPYSHLPICHPPGGNPWNQLKFDNT